MTETNRSCARCKQTLPKKKYSRNQWSKGTNKSKCKGCVSDKVIPKEVSSSRNKLKRFMKRKVGKKKQQQDQVVAVVSDTEDEGNCSTEATCIPLPAVIWSRSMTYLPASDFLNTLTTMSSNKSMLKEALPTIIVQTRTILSKDLSPIQQAADISGLSKILFDLMACEDSSPKLRFDATSILSVIASENSKSVVETGAISVFVSLLSISSSDRDLCSAAVLGLGNIAADCRTDVMASGVIQPLLELLKSGKDLSIQRSATWLLSNLCRGAHKQDFCLQSFDTLSLLLSNPDEEILVESCWALVSLTNEDIESVVEANFCPRLCELLNHSSQEVVIPALRAVGNVATGSSVHIQVLLDNNVLPALLYLLSHERKLIQTEACWVISSVASGTIDQIQYIVDNANILPKLIQLMSRRAGDLTLCMEATYAIVNVARKGNATQVNELMRLDIVRPLVQSLDKDLKAKHTFIILNGLHYVSSM